MAGFQAPPRRRKGKIVIIVALALAVAACGRKGDPLPPPDPNAPPAAKSSDTLGGLGRPSNPPIEKPHKPFILDPLL